MLKELAKHLRRLHGSLGESLEELSSSNTTTHIGKRGGRYKEDITKDDRPNRRYF